MDLLKLIDQNVECVATPNGRYLKRSEVFEVVEKFTSTNTGSPKLPTRTEFAVWVAQIGTPSPYQVYDYLDRQLRAGA